MAIEKVDDKLIEERLAAVADEDTMMLIQTKAEEIRRLMTYYRCAMMEIETKFKVLNEEFSLKYDRNPISGIKTRLKSIPSITEKLKRRDLSFDAQTIENYINDVAGIRVICSFQRDVYQLADALLKQDDLMLIKRKDYIENPKPNGYRSLHLIVAVPIFLAKEKRLMKVEIQLRTLAMDFWASLEHQLRYKKNFDLSEETEKELLECANQSSELDMRMDKIRQGVFE